MDFTEIFLEEANKYPEFIEAKEIAKKNSKGNLFLIGGFIYRNIAANLYGTKKPEIDLDFISEKISEDIFLPERWKLSKSRMGCLKFVGPEYNIDLVHLKDIFSIEMFGLKPEMDSFFSTTPLNIQSIAYDFSRNKIIGEKGIEALEKRILIPINKEKIRNYVAEKKEMSFENYIKKYAKELNFDYIFP